MSLNLKNLYSFSHKWTETVAVFCQKNCPVYILTYIKKIELNDNRHSTATHYRVV